MGLSLASVVRGPGQVAAMSWDVAKLTFTTRFQLREFVEQAWFVAGHWWDVTGAARVGLRTAWIGRDEGVLLPSAPEPDVRAADLREAAEAIAAA